MYETMTWDQRVAADAALSERRTFIQNTYLHVGGALLAYALMLVMLVNFAPVEWMTVAFRGRGGLLILMVVFLVGSYAAQYMAQGHFSKPVQYAGLALYTALVSFISWPAVYICSKIPGYEGILPQAVIITLAIAAALTVSVFVTKADFSWMRSGLMVLGLLVPAIIIGGIIFDFTLGLWFTAAIGLLICGFILYETSMVMHHYRTSEYVGAALAIFASIATLFRIVLSLLMSSRD